LSKLASKLPGNENVDKGGPPFVLGLIKKCQKYEIDYQVMCDLNFDDLLALVTEYDIQSIKEYFKSKQKEANEKRGINVTEASNDDIMKMHKK